MISRNDWLLILTSQADIILLLIGHFPSLLCKRFTPLLVFEIRLARCGSLHQQSHRANPDNASEIPSYQFLFYKIKQTFIYTLFANLQPSTCSASSLRLLV